MMRVDLGCWGTPVQVHSTFPSWVILNEDEAVPLSKNNKVTYLIETEQDPTCLSYLQGPSMHALFLIDLDLPASLCNWKVPFLPLADRITHASIPGNWKCTTL